MIKLLNHILFIMILQMSTNGGVSLEEPLSAISAIKIHSKNGWRLNANQVSEPPTGLFLDEVDDVVDPLLFLNFSIPEKGPYFDLTRTRNVSALKGVTTKLVCRVRRLGDLEVSWIRHSDLHLLTVGRYTYTSDQRFESFHSPHTHDWILRIKTPQPKDTGVYECQISATPHMSQRLYLDVREPNTYFIGGPDMFVDLGSMVNLSCVISHTEKPPTEVKWFHRDTEISFRGPRDGVSVITEKAEHTTVHLLMQGARPSDSGIYTCVPNNAPSAKIKVHILQGNQVAGLQTNKGSTHHFLSLYVFFVYINIVFFIIQ